MLSARAVRNAPIARQIRRIADDIVYVEQTEMDISIGRLMAG